MYRVRKLFSRQKSVRKSFLRQKKCAYIVFATEEVCIHHFHDKRVCVNRFRIKKYVKFLNLMSTFTYQGFGPLLDLLLSNYNIIITHPILEKN